MAESTAIIRAGTLIIETSSNDKRREIPAESEAWFAWLQTARTFAFDDSSGRFTARTKPRWGGIYWYAFRRYGGRLYETYLGKPRDITLDRLRAAAAKLSQKAEHMSSFQTAATERRRSVSAEISGQNLTYQSITQSAATTMGIPPISLSDLVHTRALERLEQATRCSLTIVSAPAGYGKTTLIAHWIALSHLPTAWLTLEDSDNDPALFWGRVCAVLAQLVPLPSEVMQQPAEISASQRNDFLLTALVVALAKAATPIILVLDDYHKVRPDNTAIHMGIAYLLGHLPPHAQVMLASRTVPAVPLAKLRADKQLLELYVDDLQFNLTETSAFLSERMRVELPDDELILLQARTEGWVVGLQLAILSLQEQPDVARWVRDFNGENRYVFDYLVEEVLNNLPAKTREFVLQISLLERFNASLCDALTQSTNSQAILEELERSNLFLAPLDDRREWYHFHPLFADVLRRYFRSTMPRLVSKRLSRASEWSESHGLLLDAIDYAFAANELERAARLVETYIPGALAGGQRALVLDKLHRLPDGLVRERPRLCVAHAYTLFMSGEERPLMRQRVRDAEESLARTQHLFEPADLAILWGEVLALRTGIRYLLMGDMVPRELVYLHQQALAALPRHHWLRNFTSLFIGIEQFVDGNVRAAARTLEALMRTSEADSDVFYIAMSALYLGLALLQQGRLDDALARCNRIEPYLIDHMDADLTAHIYMIKAKVFFERNDLAQALDCLRQGISLRYDPATFLIEAFSTLAYLRHALGNRAAAQQAIQQSLMEWTGMQAENIPVWVWTGRQVRAHQARLWLLDDNLEAASAWARTIERYNEDETGATNRPPTFVREWEDIVKARVYLGEQRAQEALTVLDKQGKVAEADGRKSRLLEILVLQAIAYDAIGNAPAAMLTLKRAVELGAPQQFVRAFVDGGPTIQRLLTLLRAERAGHPTRLRTHRETTLLHYIESLLIAFEALNHNEESRSAGSIDAASESEGSNATGTPAGPDPALTQRELQVMRLLSDGATNKEIAADLVISEATVKRHVSNILMALNVRNRTQAVTRAREFHLLGAETEGTTPADTGP